MRYNRVICLGLLILIIASYGCIKETYDFDNLSSEAQLSPTLIIPVFKGSTAFSDLVDPGESFITEADGSVKLVFRKDSVIFLTREDFYDMDDMISYSRSFQTGNLKIEPFGGTLSFLPAEIVNNYSAKSFPGIPNFTKANFSAGTLELKITNRMTESLMEFNFSLKTTAGIISDQVMVPSLKPGEEFSTAVNISGLELSNTLTVTVSGASMTGLENVHDVTGDILFGVTGKDLVISSGKAVIPLQRVSDPDSRDCIDLFPGTGVEIDKIMFTKGKLAWKAVTSGLLGARFDITLPTLTRNGAPLSEHLMVNSLYTNRGSISLSGITATLDSDPGKSFNRIPFTYNLSVSSNNAMVNFDSNDNINLEIGLIDPEPDYVKGYFGQQVHTLPSHSLNTGIEEFTGKLRGRFLLTDPVVRLNYSNSFSLPINVALNVEGKKGSGTVSLGLDPFSISFPDSPEIRDVQSTYEIGKNNSSLPDLISLPPDEIVFSGSAKFNPADDLGKDRDNYIFGNSRFVASVEVEVPLKIRLDRLQLSDTLDNFLSGDKVYSAMNLTKSGNKGNIQILKFGLIAKNGFPFEVSFRMGLYDSSTGKITGTMDAPSVLKAAKTDQSGMATLSAETVTSLDFSGEFLESLNAADKIIFDFFVNTSDSKEIRIFTDYRIDFSTTVTVRPEFDFELP